MRVFILGGGPAGLALANGLSEVADSRFVLYEYGAELGGLARSVRWEPHGAHDLGPHKIFTLDVGLMERVKRLLPRQDWIQRPKRSSIWMRGHFLPYPPSPFSLLQVFGPQLFARMLMHYGLARARNLLPAREPETFEEDLLLRVGSGLFDCLFEPIASKLWGHPAELDVKLSKGRVQTPKVTEVIRNVLGIRRSSGFEALTFWYPRGGLQQLWHAIRERGESRGEFLTSHEIARIELDKGRVTRIHAKDRRDGAARSWDVKPDDFVFSTLPVTKLLEMLDGLGGDALERARRSVQLNDLILVFLKVDRQSLVDESWVFVPDEDIAFHRLSEQESFDPGMTPGGSIVCCEIMSHSRRPFVDRSDGDLVALARTGLEKMGYRGFEVSDSKVMRLRRSYPVYRPRYQADLTEVLEQLDGLENLRSIGRQGAFNYIGTLDAMDIGYGAARWLAAARRGGDAEESWRRERERTSHYPVLD